MAGAGVSKKGGKKNRKYGRDLEKCKIYKNSHTREFNKAVRIARSSGVDKALEYSIPFGISGKVRARIAHFAFRNPEVERHVKSNRNR